MCFWAIMTMFYFCRIAYKVQPFNFATLSPILKLTENQLVYSCKIGPQSGIIIRIVTHPTTHPPNHPSTHPSHRRRLKLESRARSRSVSIKHQLVSSDVEENKMKMKSLKSLKTSIPNIRKKKLSISSVTKVSISHYNHDRYKNLQTTYWYFYQPN